MKNWLRLIRIHQWSKNLILFVPLLTSHRFLEPGPFWAAVVGFFSFSFLASASYILNDLLDISHDRNHPTKKSRPLASGVLSYQGAKIVGILLEIIGFILALLLPKGFSLCLGVYLGLSLVYSLWIKRVAVADVTLLAGLYTLRLLAGQEAEQITYSVWLLVFAIFFFFSLAIVKRYVELQESESKPKLNVAGRGYQSADLFMVGALGASSGLVSVLVILLYVNSTEVRMLYARPTLLLLLAPLFLYWIGRLWILACRKELHEDPVVFALRDRVSYLVGALILMILCMSAV